MAGARDGRCVEHACCCFGAGKGSRYEHWRNAQGQAMQRAVCVRAARSRLAFVPLLGAQAQKEQERLFPVG